MRRSTVRCELSEPPLAQPLTELKLRDGLLMGVHHEQPRSIRTTS